MGSLAENFCGFREPVLSANCNPSITAVEAPFTDTDFEHWKRFCAEWGSTLKIIGTVSETIEAIRMTQDAGWLPVVSARSGETEDAFISHLAVATNAGQLKVGSFARSERMVKWNENLRIQRSLGSKASFLGGKIYERILR